PQVSTASRKSASVYAAAKLHLIALHISDYKPVRRPRRGLLTRNHVRGFWRDSAFSLDVCLGHSEKCPPRPVRSASGAIPDLLVFQLMVREVVQALNWPHCIQWLSEEKLRRVKCPSFPFGKERASPLRAHVGISERFAWTRNGTVKAAHEADLCPVIHPGPIGVVDEYAEALLLGQVL